MAEVNKKSFERGISVLAAIRAAIEQDQKDLDNFREKVEEAALEETSDSWVPLPYSETLEGVLENAPKQRMPGIANRRKTLLALTQLESALTNISNDNSVKFYTQPDTGSSVSVEGPPKTWLEPTE